MSNMKDYMMWLDTRGIATWDNTLGELLNPMGVNLYGTHLTEAYKNDAKWHGVELDDEDCIIDDEEELIIDDGDMDDCAWTPDDYWFQQQGGLTADAYNFLHTLDSQGELV